MPGKFFGPYGEQYKTPVFQTHANLGQFPLGHTLILPDDREYRFTLNDGTVEIAGNLYQAVAAVADHNNTTADVARAIAATAISSTLGATAAAVDIYTEGMVHVNDEVGEGYSHRILRAMTAGAAHASAATSSVLTVNLAAGGSTNPNGASGFQRAFGTRCTTCHARIHGSDTPSQGISGGGKALIR